MLKNLSKAQFFASSGRLAGDVSGLASGLTKKLLHCDEKASNLSLRRTNLANAESLGN